jgi:calcineurin-like phosphoesterase family protein
MNVIFGSDFHLGHRRIGEFRAGVGDSDGNTQLIMGALRAKMSKRSTLITLGDVAFDEASLMLLKDLPGKKILVRGNHDILPLDMYREVFSEVHGLLKYKEFWLSHPPIHPLELHGRFNLHGHVHYATVPDQWYVNCCVENAIRLTGSPLMDLTTVRGIIRRRKEENANDWNNACDRPE